MLGQSLARHPHDRGGGGVDLKTPNIAALAFDAAERLDAGVTNLAGGAINATPKFPIKNDRAAHACAEGEADNRFAVARRAAPHLAQRRGIRIVLKQHRLLKCLAQRRRQTKAGQRRNVRSVDDYSGPKLHRSGDDNRHCLDLRAPLQAFRLALAHSRDDGGDDIFSFICFRSCGFGAPVDAPIAINIRSAQIRAAQIDGADEIV